VKRGPIGSRQGVCAALGERTVRVGLGDPADERVDAPGEFAGFVNFFHCPGFGGFARRDAEYLAAVEKPAAVRSPPVDRAAAPVVGGTGLAKKVAPFLPFRFQAQRGERAGRFARLKLDRVEQDPVAAHAACGAKTGGGWRDRNHET